MLQDSKIITITQGGILWRDDADIVQWLDFRESRAAWIRSRENILAMDRRYVGYRNIELGQACWVRFFADPQPTFYFPDKYSCRISLLVPIGRFGWFTTTLGLSK